MGVYAGAEEILAGADSRYAVAVGWLNRLNGRLCRRPLYLYIVLKGSVWVESS